MFLINYCKRMGIKRFICMLFGNILIGLGVGLFRYAMLGCSPFDGMNIQISTYLPISYALTQMLMNLLLLIVQFILARGLIGAGTIINAVLCPVVNTFFYGLFIDCFGETKSLPVSITVIVIGIIICGFGISLYQTPNIGVAPYDSLALILDRHLKKLPYFWCRMITDSICVIVCAIAGGFAAGNLGIGTIISVFGFGPFIHFFNKVFTEKVITPMQVAA